MRFIFREPACAIVRRPREVATQERQKDGEGQEEGEPTMAHRHPAHPCRPDCSCYECASWVFQHTRRVWRCALRSMLSSHFVLALMLRLLPFAAHLNGIHSAESLSLFCSNAFFFLLLLLHLMGDFTDPLARKTNGAAHGAGIQPLGPFPMIPFQPPRICITRLSSQSMRFLNLCSGDSRCNPPL